MTKRPTILIVVVLSVSLALSSSAGAVLPGQQPDAVQLHPANNLGTRPQSLRAPMTTAAPAAVAANSTTFQDSVGEDPSAPDITTIVVSNDDAANISFSVNTPNRPQYSSDIALVMFLDSDANQATGDPESLGADYIIQLIQAEILLFKWDGSDYTLAASPSLAYAWSGGPTVRINAADLNNTRRLNFDVTVVSGVAFTSTGAIDCANCRRDFAPTTGFYAYQLLLGSQPPPPSNPPPDARKTYEDAPHLPPRIKYVGSSVKHVRLGEKLYSTMKRLHAPRVVAIACWSKADWPSVQRSAHIDPDDRVDGFWLPNQPRWVHLSPKQCTDVQGLMSDRQPNGQRAYALSTVLHERIHAQGYGIEAQAECFSVQLVYDFARELNFTHTKAMRLEQLAVRISNRRMTGTKYRDPVRCRDGGPWDLFPEFSNLTY